MPDTFRVWEMRGYDSGHLPPRTIGHYDFSTRTAADEFAGRRSKECRPTNSPDEFTYFTVSEFTAPVQ